MSIQPMMTVGDVAATVPGALRVFERMGIDACCGGRRTLADACTEAGLHQETLIDALERALQDEPPPSRDWAKAPLPALVDHLATVHHRFTREELARAGFFASRAARSNGEPHPDMQELCDLIGALRGELIPHMDREETVLFPSILALEEMPRGGPPPALRLGRPMAVMEREHELTGELLRAIRSATNDFTPPHHANDTHRSLYTCLEGLERDLYQHIHLEQNILFPRARTLEESRLRARKRPEAPALSRSMASLLHSHETFQSVFDEASDAAQHLIADPRSLDAPEHCLTAWQFVFGYALPHLEREDSVDFPALEQAGAPPEALYLLGEDHRVLRELAARLAGAGLRTGAEELSEEAADLLIRFLRAFDWHVAREETMLKDLVSELG